MSLNFKRSCTNLQDYPSAHHSHAERKDVYRGELSDKKDSSGFKPILENQFEWWEGTCWFSGMPKDTSVHIPVEEIKPQTCISFCEPFKLFKKLLNFAQRTGDKYTWEHVILRNIFIPRCGRKMPEGSKVVFYHAYVPPI